MQVFTTQQLGPNQHTTPEGFLLCSNVPVARTGPMLYHGDELKNDKGGYEVRPSNDGYVRIIRDAEEVFRPETIASFAGKPVVISHPNSMVTPDTYSQLAVGTMLNPRRGTGLQDDYMFADLLITSPVAINLIRTKQLGEVSCGYDAQYQELSPGRGRQLNIVGNHVALVDKGRCGPQCSIGDSAMSSVLDRVRNAFRTADQTAFDAAMQEMTGNMTPANPTLGSNIAGGSGNEPHRIIVNVHGTAANAGPATDAPTPTPGGGPVGGPAVPGSPSATGSNPAVAPAEGGAGAIDQRLAGLETSMQQLMQLIQSALEVEDPTADPSATSRTAPPGSKEGGGSSNLPGTKDMGDLTEPLVAPKTTGMMGTSGTTGAQHGSGAVVSDEGLEKLPKVEGMLGELHKGAKELNKTATGDSAALAETYQDTITRAEILFPGLKPKATFDAAAKAISTEDCICDLQRRALTAALGVDATKGYVKPLLGTKDLAAMSADNLAMLFIGASELAKRGNNAGMLRNKIVANDIGTKAPMTTADINKRNHEFWAKRGAVSQAYT